MPYCGPSGSTEICRWANVAPGDEVEVEFDMPEGCKARESWMFIRGCLMLTMMTFSGSNKVHVCEVSRIFSAGFQNKTETRNKVYVNA